eukprot:EG_transcript_18447
MEIDKEQTSYAILLELYNKEPAGLVPEELPEHQSQVRVFRDLTYNAGYGYLIGMGAGSIVGLYEGLLEQTATKSWKLARTSVLNAAGRRASAMANAGGTIGTMFCILEAGFRQLMLANKDRPVPWVTHPWAFDSRNTAPAAGFTCGLIYKSTAGNLGVTLAAGVVGGAVAFLNSRRYTPEKYFDIYKKFLPSEGMLM